MNQARLVSIYCDLPSPPLEHDSHIFTSSRCVGLVIVFIEVWSNSQEFAAVVMISTARTSCNATFFTRQSNTWSFTRTHLVDLRRETIITIIIAVVLTGAHTTTQEELSSYPQMALKYVNSNCHWEWRLDCNASTHMQTHNVESHHSLSALSKVHNHHVKQSHNFATRTEVLFAWKSVIAFNDALHFEA
jgi:hypothetical protein